jgi:ribosomal protein S18 acetylase RimI-like enzyme
VLTLRQATIEDVPVLARLGEATYRSHFTTIWSPARLETYIVAEYGAAALTQSLVQSLVHSESAWLIAEADGAPIGFAKLNWDRPLPVPPARSGTELQKIYLLAEWTGQGHGGAMLQGIVARAEQRGDRMVWLDVLKSNTGARAFYERHGLKVVGELPFATDLREIGFWVMAREL